MTLTPKQYAAQVLDRLIELDAEVSGAFYEMGQLLSSLEHGKLWSLLDYTSFGHMVEEEMSFSPATAFKYLRAFRDFNRLGYSKSEALSMIQEHSFTRVADYLSSAQMKVGKRAVANAIKKGIENRRQINFTLNKDQYDLVERVLMQHGAEVSEHGRWLGSTEAFIDALKSVPLRKTILHAVK